MRSVLDGLELMESLHRIGMPNLLDKVRRVVVFVVNSVTEHQTHWDERERPPGAVSQMMQASGVPIEHYSYESIELLKDRAVRWRGLRQLRQSAAFAHNTDPAIAAELNGPEAEIYVIDVSFAALKDEAESRYLKELPTSFVLPA